MANPFKRKSSQRRSGKKDEHQPPMKIQHIAFEPFFKGEPRLTCSPKSEDFGLHTARKDVDSRLSDPLSRQWLQDLWHAGEVLVTMLCCRDIYARSLHMSRSLTAPDSIKVPTQIALDCLVVARTMLQEMPDKNSPFRPAFSQKPHMGHFLGPNDEYINDNSWVPETSSAFAKFLQVLAKRGLGCDVLSFLQLLAMGSWQTSTSTKGGMRLTEDRVKSYLDMLELDMRRQFSILVLRGLEIW